MSYEWITPKTDWTTTSRFEYTDYNRIRNNLLYLNDMLNEMYPEKAQPLDLGDAKTGYANEYSVSEFIAFEDALESFTRIGRDVNIGDRNYYRGNNSFIWADALNRLETCCLRWKDELISKDCKEYQLPYNMANGGSSTTSYIKNTPVEARSERLFIAGGGGTFDGTDNIYSFDGNNWTKFKSLPYSMFSGALFTITGEDLYVLGGQSYSQYVPYFYSYNPSWVEWQNKPNYPVPIAGIDGCIAILNDDLFVFGGYRSSDVREEDDNTYKIDIQLASWSDKIDGVYMHDGSAIVYDDYFLTIEEDQTFITKRVWANNQMISTVFCSLPHKNNGGKLVKYHNNIYYFGGSSTDKGYYKLEGNEFVKVGELTYPFSYGTVSIFSDKIYCIGGVGKCSDKMYEILTY